MLTRSLTHMIGGTDYLGGILGIEPGAARADDGGYRDAVAQCVEALHAPGALDRRCMSPAGFEWSVAEATAGTAMDQLVHTWDLAVAIGADRRARSRFGRRDRRDVPAADARDRSRGGHRRPRGCRRRRRVAAGSAARCDGTATVTVESLDEAVRAMGIPVGARCCGVLVTKSAPQLNSPRSRHCRRQPRAHT